MSNNERKIERKTIEKNRRNEMKYLCSKLVSLIPPHHFNSQKEFSSQQDQIEQATDYIKEVSARIEELKKKKAQALSRANSTTRKGGVINHTTISRSSELLPVVRVRDLGCSILEVVLISGIENTNKLMVHRLIQLLEEEGTEIVNLTLSYIGNKIFHTLQAQVKVARIGVDISRICGRLEEELIC